MIPDVHSSRTVTGRREWVVVASLLVASRDGSTWPGTRDRGAARHGQDKRHSSRAVNMMGLLHVPSHRLQCPYCNDPRST